MKPGKQYIEDILYGRKRSLLIEPLLGLLSLLYAAGVRLRHALYGAGIFKRKKIGQQVISVGNLTLGGTGKTPAVINIAGLLKAVHRRPAVISRGYGRRDESEVLVVSDGNRILMDAGNGGDEPVLMASNLAGVPVVVGSDRFRAANICHDKFGNDTIILDDGFQHIGLHRDLDIVLINARDPFGNGKLFPAGILREPLSALRRAQVVLITGVEPGSDLTMLKALITEHTDSQIFTSRTVPKDIVNITTGEVRPLSALQGAKVYAFAGIARPASFFSLLRAQRADIRKEAVFADHYQYSPSDLARLVRDAADTKADMTVTTEKDAVRLKDLIKTVPVWAVRIELSIVEKEAWEAILSNRA